MHFTLVYKGLECVDLQERNSILNHITEEFSIQILVEKSSDTSGAGWIEHWGIPVFSKVR